MPHFPIPWAPYSTNPRDILDHQPKKSLETFRSIERIEWVMQDQIKWALQELIGEKVSCSFA
jgi:hypothetical protein